MSTCPKCSGTGKPERESWINPGIGCAACDGTGTVPVGAQGFEYVVRETRDRVLVYMETGDVYREGERLLHNIQFSHPRPDVAAYMLVQFGKAILSVPVGLGATKEDAMKSAIRNYVTGSRD